METLFELPPVVVDVDKKQKRKWENAFQRWSDKMSQDGSTPEGCCGFGQLCDFCEDNSFGRPCVRAFNFISNRIWNSLLTAYGRMMMKTLADMRGE